MPAALLHPELQRIASPKRTRRRTELIQVFAFGFTPFEDVELFSLTTACNANWAGCPCISRWKQSKFTAEKPFPGFSTMTPRTLNDIFFAIVSRNQSRVALTRQSIGWVPVS